MSRLLIIQTAVAVQQLPAASIDAPTAKERAKKATAAKGSEKAKACSEEGY
jgi:hypothetical protein